MDPLSSFFPLIEERSAKLAEKTKLPILEEIQQAAKQLPAKDSFTSVTTAGPSIQSNLLQHQRPTYLYHITTDAGWEKICESGKIQAHVEDGNPRHLAGIFTVDLQNFVNEWGPTKYPYYGPEYPHYTYMNNLIDWVNRRNRWLPPKSPKGLKILQIKVDPSDSLSLRDNKPANGQLSDETLRSIESVETLPLAEGKLPEFIIHNNIPLDRIKVFSSFEPKYLHHFNGASNEFYLFDILRPAMMNPEFDAIFSELGIDASSVRNSVSLKGPVPYEKQNTLNQLV